MSQLTTPLGVLRLNGLACCIQHGLYGYNGFLQLRDIAARLSERNMERIQRGQQG